MLGRYHNRLDKICDVDYVAHILTLRAASQGIYRVYDRKAVSKNIRRGNLTPVPEEELPEVMRAGPKKYYLIDDAWNMQFNPTKGRKSPTVEEYRASLGAIIEQARKERVPQWRIERARMMLELAAEAESTVKAVQEEQQRIEKELAAAVQEQKDAEAYGAFLYTKKDDA
jgi:hypothetical protein